MRLPQLLTNQEIKLMKKNLNPAVALPWAVERMYFNPQSDFLNLSVVVSFVLMDLLLTLFVAMSL